jgi:hypothetical protein
MAAHKRKEDATGQQMPMYAKMSGIQRIQIEIWMQSRLRRTDKM